VFAVRLRRGEGGQGFGGGGGVALGGGAGLGEDLVARGRRVGDLEGAGLGLDGAGGGGGGGLLVGGRRGRRGRRRHGDLGDAVCGCVVVGVWIRV
jgi:hypothetical protein